ncbi:MAG: hypothetical protein ACTSRZ_09410 [Promethearchaeota archaeon]
MINKENLQIKKQSYIIGKYIEGKIWINFDDKSRKFYEKSYYGNLYNRDKQEIKDIYDLAQYNEDSEEFSFPETLSVDKRPAYIVLDPLEALYLIEKNKLKVFLNESEENNETKIDDINSLPNKFQSDLEITFNRLIEKCLDTDPNIWTKYIIYRELRLRGYIIRVGYGGRVNFRVYSRGAKYGKDSSKFVYSIVEDGIPIGLNELDILAKQVLGDRKNLILSIIDKLGDSIFYKLEIFNFKKINDFEERWNKNVELIDESPVTNVNPKSISKSADE